MTKLGSLLYSQSDFSGGLFTQFDATKTPRNSYPLGLDVQMRRNVVKPRNRHARQTTPEGEFHGLYAVGSQLYLFVAGEAYVRDVATSSYFNDISGWTTIDSTIRVYAERLPITFNLFNRRAATVETTTLYFNTSIAAYPECLWVGNGRDAEQVIYPDGTAELIGDYDAWSQNDPSYVPIGTVRVFTADKGFVMSPNGLKLYSSVTGRPTDYVIQIDNAGNKVSDADSFYTGVSAEAVTALKAADNGTVIATTAFGTFTITPDYNTTFYGEPFLRVRPLFPVGAVNDKSFVNLNGDVAFISFTGIHTFNQTKQDRIESSNEPLGRKIYGLLANPQTDTCAVDFDDNALFAVNTIYGRGVMVYDNSLEQFTSLDLSFGHVTQFAVVNDPVLGPRLFFINAANELYEAYADDTKLAGRIYLGDFTAPGSGIDSRIDSVFLTFTNVRAGGQVKCSLWIDGENRGEQVQAITAADLPASDDAIPRIDAANTKQLQFNFAGRNEGARVGIWVEWDADAELTDASLYGDASAQRQVDGVIVDEPYAQLWFAAAVGADDIADSGTEAAVTQGDPTVFVPGAGEKLTTGNLVITKPTLFYPPGDYVQITPGTDYLLGSFASLFDAFGTADTKTTLFSLNQFLNTDQPDAAAMQRAYTYVDTAIARLRFKEFHILAGTTEYTNPADFFKWARRGRYFTVNPIAGVEVFNYDPGLDYLASQLIDANGLVGVVTGEAGSLSAGAATLANTNVVANTFAITIGSDTAVDDGDGNIVASGAIAGGTINYVTGAITVTGVAGNSAYIVNYRFNPSKNPDGYDADSIQAREHYQRVIDSTATYKIVVCPLPAYLEAGTEDVGRGYHDLRHIGRGASIVITGKNWGDETYYRQTVDGVIWVALFDSAVLKITASELGLHCEAEQAGVLVDVFDIVKPS